jgi:methylmalonyl-CoA/ethylmalonyl-CoA epimerase
LPETRLTGVSDNGSLIESSRGYYILPTPPPALPHVSAHHFSVSVPDLEAAIAWYSDTFGFVVEHRFEIAAIPAKGTFLRSPAIRLELWQALGNAPVPEERKTPNSDLKTCGTKHIAFAVPDLQGCLKELVQRGIDIAAVQRDPSLPMQPEADPLVPGKQPAFAVFIRDPFGTLIELIDQSRA